MDGVQNSERENPRFSVLYHQATAENAVKILEEGFKRGLRGAGSNGPLRGIFLKEIPDILSGAGIGQSQIEVSINPKVRLLDLRNQGISTVDSAEANERLAYQHFALTHWLDRNGHPELAEDYQYAVGDLMRDKKPESLDDLWPKIEQLLKDKGYGGVIYKDFHIEGDKEDEEFTSIVVFNPEDLTVKK